MLKQAAPDSILKAELEALQATIGKSRRQAISELIRLLRISTHQDTKWLIAKILGSAKDERVIRPLIQAVKSPENAGHSSNFIWQLTNYDCSSYLKFFVDFMLKSEGPDESMMTCIPVIKAMKGPFEPELLRNSIKKLLAESKEFEEPDYKLASEAFKAEVADFLMANYFNHYYRAYWKDWGKFTGEKH